MDNIPIKKILINRTSEKPRRIRVQRGYPHTIYIFPNTMKKIKHGSDISRSDERYTRSMNARVAKCLHKYIYSTRLAIRRRGVCVLVVYIYIYLNK